MSLCPIFPKLSTVQVLISSATVTQSVKKSSTASTQALSIFAMPTNMYTTYRLSRSWSGQNRTYYRNSWSKKNIDHNVKTQDMAFGDTGLCFLSVQY